jgi:hypothetical protein
MGFFLFVLGLIKAGIDALDHASHVQCSQELIRLVRCGRNHTDFFHLDDQSTPCEEIILTTVGLSDLDPFYRGSNACGRVSVVCL